MNKVAGLIVLIITGLIAFCVWYLGAIKPIDTSDQTRILFKIDAGESVTMISEHLEEKEVIRSASAFMLFTKFHGLEGGLQAGSFVLKPSLSVAEIVDVLRTGKAQEVIITIPEGFTVKDIDALLTKKGLIEAEAFSICANECDLSTFTFLPNKDGLAERGGRVEGYLYPDTYFVISDGFSAESFMNRLLSTFQKKIVDGLASYIEESPRSLHEIVTMASLIEEETRGDEDEERPMVSGILWNRFDAGSGLGVDATVRYILNKPTAEITVADLNSNNEYNTRKFRGLPPGPIANPGYDSILAALKPQESDYWYYLHDKNGDIHYAKTNEEHNINKYNYLR